MGLEIVLETLNYVAGDQIKGFVRFTPSSLQKLNGIKIQFNGEALTHWTKNLSRKGSNGRTHRETVHYRGAEEYCKIKYYLIGRVDNHERLEILPGLYTYPFSFQLPPTIPPSYEGKWGSVSYKIITAIDIPWDIDVVQETCINITCPLDLNFRREYENPYTLKKKNTFCCLCCASLPLNVQVTVPVTGYTPGQSIPLTIECDNRSDIDIDSIQLRLVRKVMFHAQYPVHETKYEEYVISTVSFGSLPGGKSTTRQKNLLVPNETIPHLRHCEIITFSDKIDFDADPSGCHLTVNGEIPIILGTIGLMSYQPPSSELEINNITHTMGAASSTYVPSSPTNIGWNVAGNNPIITEQPVNYYELPDAKYPPPYSASLPIINIPSAPIQ